MKRTKKSLTVIAALAIIASSALLVVAGSVFDRAVCALSTTAGTGVWTNDSDYAAITLDRVQIQSALLAGDTVTVTRVSVISSTLSYTDTLATVVCSSSKGSWGPTNTYGLKDGDKLNFASSTGTGAVAIIEYHFEKH